MEKYQYTDKCRKMFCYGQVYEDACRRMVIAGMEWLDEHPDADIKIDTYNRIFDMTVPMADDIKKLEDVMSASAECGNAGNVIQDTVNHVLYARKIGWDAYIREWEKVGEERTRSNNI
jgi:hypothetical protein